MVAGPPNAGKSSLVNLLSAWVGGGARARGRGWELRYWAFWAREAAREIENCPSGGGA